MQKSDTRINLTAAEYEELALAIQRFSQILLSQLKKERNEIKDVVILFSLSRAVVQLDSILKLWKLQYYSDCLILYRTQVERLLTLHYLIDTNSYKEFSDWSFIQNFESRNEAKSDGEQNQFLDKKFWTESEERIQKYKRLKEENVIWDRPTKDKLKSVAKRHNLLFLYKYGYKYASGHVHPLASDGKNEFEIITGENIETQDKLDTTPILNNAILVVILFLELVVTNSENMWHKCVHDMLDSTKGCIEKSSLTYKEHLECIEFMFNKGHKIFKYAT